VKDSRIALGLGLLVLLAYANSLGNGFAMDANTLVLQDPRIRHLSAENLRLILQNDYWWPTFTLGVYRPLTTLSYLLNWSVLGGAGSPFGYHLINLLLHAANVWLVWLLAQRVLTRGAAFFAAALWAVHPIGVESVSNVTGRLRKEKTAFDLLRATFPAGTLSGAPKVRAMQIIEEMEPTRRGVYGGAIGYFSYNGNLDACITIRTVVVKDGVAYVQAGGGIVADSDPEAEFDETVNKSNAVRRAIEMAERGLQ